MNRDIETSAGRAIWALGLVLGCAGADGSLDGEEAVPEPGLPELGQLQQALPGVPGVPGLPDAYGIDRDMNRCWTDGGNFEWGGERCRVPSHRSGWTVYVPSTNSTKGCTNPAVRTDIKDAAVLWAARMQAEGWDVTVSTAAEVAGDRKFAIKCDTSTPTDANGNIIEADTRIPVACDSRNTHFCLETPYGILVLYNDVVDIRLFVRNIGNSDREYIRNVVTHELGHVFGLGHDTPAETCLMQPTMSGAGCASPFTVLRGPTTFELDMLLEYVPLTEL